MTSRERAEAVVQKINSQRNRIAGGYEIPRDEPGPIDLIAAALEAERPKWSQDKPTVAGQYWCRIIGQYEPFTIFVHANDDGEGLGILLAEDDWVSVHDEELSKADWCPLPMPEEGA